jgi:hypothetical protein
VNRRQLHNCLALLCMALYAYLLLIYVGRGNLSLWTPVVAIAAIFVADLAGGITHFVLDYTPNASGVGLYELFHYKESKGSDVYTEQRDKAMRKINGFHELVFDFKVHHLSPATLGRRPIAQMTLPIIVFADLPVTALLLVLGELQLIAVDISFFMLVFLAAVTVSQYAHSCTHRNDPPAVVRFLQKTKLFVGKEAHSMHHRDPTQSFCLLNGWANPIVDILFKICLKRGIFNCEGLKVVR